MTLSRGCNSSSEPDEKDPSEPSPCCSVSSSPTGVTSTPGEHFGRMIANCLEYALAAKAEGRPIVGIMCEYTPRELILAGGGVPVCLCGGSAETIPAAETELPANLPLHRPGQGDFIWVQQPEKHE